VGTDAFSVRIHYKPLVNWIWGGCLLMAFGGLLAVSDRRYRTRASRQTQTAAPGGGGGGAADPGRAIPAAPERTL
jgi:cytochrome c-type biogenesis protein CcmF